MIVVVVLLGIIAAVSLLSGISYRRQIKSVCRQLDFLKKHETNMIIRGDYGNRGATELIHEINDLLAVTAQIRKDSLDKQTHFKDAITSLSHDIRTPLTSLDGYFQLLSQSDNPVDRERYLEIIQRRIKSLKDMLDELFTYTKLQNDAYQIKLETCCVNKILLDTAFNFYNDFKSKGIEPTLDIPDEEIYVKGNETALRRVFQNIIKNSLEHGREAISIRLKTDSRQAVIIVANRIGRDECIQIEKVFEMFYKSDHARSHSSTGLGLAIVKALVVRMDGEIAANIKDRIFEIEIRLQLIS